MRADVLSDGDGAGVESHDRHPVVLAWCGLAQRLHRFGFGVRALHPADLGDGLRVERGVGGCHQRAAWRQHIDAQSRRLLAQNLCEQGVHALHGVGCFEISKRRVFQQGSGQRFEALEVLALQLVPCDALVLQQRIVVALLPALLTEPTHEAQRTDQRGHGEQQDEQNAFFKLHGVRLALPSAQTVRWACRASRCLRRAARCRSLPAFARAASCEVRCPQAPRRSPH